MSEIKPAAERLAAGYVAVFFPDLYRIRDRIRMGEEETGGSFERAA